MLEHETYVTTFDTKKRYRVGAETTPQLLGVRIQCVIANEHTGALSWPAYGGKATGDTIVYIERATAEQYGIVPKPKNEGGPVENPETIEDLLRRVLDELNVPTRDEITELQ